MLSLGQPGTEKIWAYLADVALSEEELATLHRKIRILKSEGLRVWQSTTFCQDLSEWSQMGSSLAVRQKRKGLCAWFATTCWDEPALYYKSGWPSAWHEPLQEALRDSWLHEKPLSFDQVRENLRDLAIVPTSSRDGFWEEWVEVQFQMSKAVDWDCDQVMQITDPQQAGRLLQHWLPSWKVKRSLEAFEGPVKRRPVISPTTPILKSGSQVTLDHVYLGLKKYRSAQTQVELMGWVMARHPNNIELWQAWARQMPEVFSQPLVLEFYWMNKVPVSDRTHPEALEANRNILERHTQTYEGTWLHWSLGCLKSSGVPSPESSKIIEWLNFLVEQGNQPSQVDQFGNIPGDEQGFLESCRREEAFRQAWIIPELEGRPKKRHGRRGFKTCSSFFSLKQSSAIMSH